MSTLTWPRKLLIMEPTLRLCSTKTRGDMTERANELVKAILAR